MRAAVQLFAFDERPQRILPTMDQWATQYHGDWEVDFHAAITPWAGDTIEAARMHPKYRVIETPSGKLSSRNMAHDIAASEGYDAIVTTDADAPPLVDDALYHLLEPLEDSDVVAVNCTPVAPGPVGGVVNFFSRMEDYISPHAHGQSMSFTTEAWEQVGPFDTDRNQKRIHTVRAEEEFAFYRRLEARGTVIRSSKARVKNDTRRVLCAIQRSRVGGPRDAFCDRRGTTTFYPRDRE